MSRKHGRHPRSTGHGQSAWARSGERQRGTSPRARSCQDGKRPARGARCALLQGGHETVRVGRTYTNNTDGVFYRPFGADRFVVVAAPRGAAFGLLPFGYVELLHRATALFLLELHVLMGDPRARSMSGRTSRRVATKQLRRERVGWAATVFVYPKGRPDRRAARPRTLRVYTWAASIRSTSDPSAGAADIRSRADTGAILRVYRRPRLHLEVRIAFATHARSNDEQAIAGVLDDRGAERRWPRTCTSTRPRGQSEQQL